MLLEDERIIKFKQLSLNLNYLIHTWEHLYCGFTDDPIKIQRINVRQNSFLFNRWARTKIVGNDNLPHVGIEVAQKSFPYYKNSNESKSFINPVRLNKKETETLFKKFNQLFNRVGERKNQIKFTRFHDLLNPIRTKGRRFSLHLLPAVSKKLDKLISEKHIKKLELCDEDENISQ